ncbi:MAG: hypothetical protein QOE73_1136 [Verrucomicrobiota bacterium]
MRKAAPAARPLTWRGEVVVHVEEHDRTFEIVRGVFFDPRQDLFGGNDQVRLTGRSVGALAALRIAPLDTPGIALLDVVLTFFGLVSMTLSSRHRRTLP